jgi:hypothetical protein
MEDMGTGAEGDGGESPSNLGNSVQMWKNCLLYMTQERLSHRVRY